MSNINRGSIGLYNTVNKGIDLLIEKAHKAIPYACMMIKDEKRGDVIVSGGFDSNLIFTSIKEARIYKEIGVQQVMNHIPDILKTNITQPFVYNLTRKYDHSKWLASLETGNVLEFKGISKDKPIKCFEGHTARVIKSEYYEFKPEFIITASEDLSWALWDTKTTDLIRKIALNYKPNWIESMTDGMVVVSDIEGYLHFYEFKE